MWQPRRAHGARGTTLDYGFTPILMGLGPIDRRAGDEVAATLQSGASTATASVFTLRRGAIVEERLAQPEAWLLYNGTVEDDFSVSCHRAGVIWQSSICWTGPRARIAHEQRTIYRARGLRFMRVRRITRTTHLHTSRQRFRPKLSVPPDFAGCFTARGIVPPG
jgi:hypothetical protein